MAHLEPDRVLRTLRLIVAAMILGVAGFAAVVVVLVSRGFPPHAAGLGRLLLLALGVLAVAEAQTYATVRALIVRRLRRAAEERGPDHVPVEDLAGSFNTITLLGAALVEGASLFALVTVLVTGQWVALAAAAVGLLLLLWLLPTHGRFSAFVAQVTGSGYR